MTKTSESKWLDELAGIQTQDRKPRVAGPIAPATAHDIVLPMRERNPAMALGLVIALASGLLAQSQWTKSNELSSRYGIASVYDPVGGHVLCYGGNDGRGRHDTWTWDGANWTQLQPANHPDVDAITSMVWDSVRSRVLLIAGVYPQPVETWTWTGNDWLQIPTTNAPSTINYSIAFDPIRDRVVLWGNYLNNGRIWELDGATDTWIEFTPAQPWPNWDGALYSITYDADASNVALYRDNINPGMWRWDGGTWTRDAGPTSDLPAQPEMIHDPIEHRLLLVGGVTTSPVIFPPVPPFPTMYEWNKTTNSWDELATGGPATSAHGVAMDTQRNAVVVVGGFWRGTWTDSSVWEWSNETWNRRTHAPPPGRREAAVAYDRSGDRVFLFGGRAGTNLGDTWVRTNGTWQVLPYIPALIGDTQPGDIRDTRIVFDEARDELLLMGGNLGIFPFYRMIDDTWEQLNVPVPPRRASPAVAYDRLRERVVLFGGDGAGLTDYADTWVWDGATWTELFPTQSPSPRRDALMSYDARRDRMVLIGGFVTAGSQGDTWEFDGAEWHLASTQGPTGIWVGGMTYDDNLQAVVAQSPFADPIETWMWDGDDWSRLMTGATPPPQANFIGTNDSLLAICGAYEADTSSEQWALATSSPARAEPFGATGTSVTGPLEIATKEALPWTDTTYEVVMTTLPPISLPGLWGGLSNVDWQGVPLPLELGDLGFPDTNLLISLEGSWPVLNLGDGSATAQIPIPDVIDLAGIVLHLQGFVFEPLSGALTTSNGLTLTIGVR